MSNSVRGSGRLMSTDRDMAHLDTNPAHSSIPSREERGRIDDRPSGGKHNMALIVGLILAAIAVVILLAMIF